MSVFGDPLSRGFWDGVERGELRVQRCAACGHAQHPGRALCVACGSDDVAWEAASGGGTLHSAAEVHRRILDGLDPPYRVGLVELDEGPRLLGFVDGDAELDDPVVVRFVDRPSGAPPGPPLWAFGRAR